MFQRPRYSLLVGLVALPVCWGCAVTPDSIPTGRWEGPGEWSGLKDEDDVKARPVSGKYTTTVTIAKRPVEGREVLVFTVLSKHPKNSELELGDVHVLLALDKPRKADDGSLEFDSFTNVQTSEGGFNKQTQFSDDVVDLLAHYAAPPAQLTRAGGEVTLKVSYEKRDKVGRLPFTESFTFSGRSLIKKGRIVSSDDGKEQIRWRENLRKVE